MKKPAPHSPSSLFLMEMLLVLLFLSLASAACVRLFGLSWQYQTRAEESRNIRLLTSFLGESLESWDGSPDSLVLPAPAEEDSSVLVLSYDKDWKSCPGEQARYTVRIAPKITKTIKQLDLTFKDQEQTLSETTLSFPLIPAKEVAS